MNCLTTPTEAERFRAVIGRQTGLRFDDAKLGFLAEVLQRRLKDKGWDADAYLWQLEYEPTAAEMNALARELTVGETYFFRNNEQFRALAEIVLPERVRQPNAVRTLRLLSAGCSSGEEAYSLAITVRETIFDPSWKVSIRAVDLNPAALDRAMRGRYSTWSLRETPIDLRTKWFREDSRDVVLDDSIRGAVAFEQANLVGDHPNLWSPAAYDVIFCRNVLMYFEPPQMRAVIARMARSLAPGGYLFLGHADTLRGVSDAFLLCNTHDTFYYQLKEGADRSIDRSVERVVPFSPRPLTTPIWSAGRDLSWFDEIRQASERVAALVPLQTAGDELVEPETAPFDPAPALELLRQERFTEALQHVRSKTVTASRDPEVLLLEATLLVHNGQLEAADEAASRLLLIDGGNAAAYYVLALCREHAGLRERAAEHHRAAAQRDPSFAMPRLHLGLLARRAGDRTVARREFAQALGLLEREDVSRLLMFGGGFSRDALIALCASALKECGGRP